MDAGQRAHWHEKGWIVVKDALPPSLIAQANQIYNDHLDGSVKAHPEDTGWDGVSFTHMWYNTGQRRPAEERHGRPRVLWGKPYYDMIDPPRVLPILQELLGDPQYGHVLPGCPPERAGQIRLDHDNTHFAAPFDPTHGPGEDGSGREWTPGGIKIGGIHGGDPVTTRTVSVIYELKPLEPGCGGTACLSGTHNPGFPRPEFAGDARQPPWPDEFNVEVVTLNVGEALIFTEKLLHSTALYRGTGERRTMFYKYQPYGSQDDADLLSGNYTIKYDLSRDELTDAQRRILAWPSQWQEHSLGEYGPGVDAADMDVDGMFKPTSKM